MGRRQQSPDLGTQSNQLDLFACAPVTVGVIEVEEIPNCCRCVCGHRGHFYSGLFEQSFCSEDCYEKSLTDAEVTQ
jgi:hypothetical protein